MYIHNVIIANTNLSVAVEHQVEQVAVSMDRTAYIYEAERINTPGHKEVNELLIKRIIISRTKHYY